MSAAIAVAAGTVRLSVAHATDTGRRREVNEDSVLVSSPVFLVADGMGGYEAGDRASAAVVDAFRAMAGDGFGTLEAIRDALVAADSAVGAVADSTKRGAGSTVAGAVLIERDGEPHWLVFNVGDSRVYRHYGSDLEQLTIDHSLGQELVDSGELRREDLATYKDRNVITRAIGAADSTADSWLVPVTNGERLLICSDGLSSELDDESIRASLTMGGRPESVVDVLVQRANRNGGRDNISVVVIDVIAGGSEPDSEYTTGAGGLHGLSDVGLDDTTIQLGGRDRG
ncbi:protein phosphatase 2C domain-containing protein [Conyzicola nivalis]|uniref:Serine/threonine protein phosphatase n=1 Tax=Conyzicola nivalis TaxID=1477021 RepID=A0A916WLI3_9MICO|nr:protein phosphatase 2C domain-containing protein [Conyzicola nivalis]GGB11585.1 serine/threonine protein phosphatase [Conyzicola nivalis]